MNEITLIQPDDWHLHVRDGDVLKDVVPHTAERFGRAIIMPNLQPPCSTTEDAKAYYERIQTAIPEGNGFEPLMVLYATDNMDPEDIYRAKESGLVKAVKLYPAGATTNSASGVTDIKHIDGVLKALTEVDMPLLVHGEVTRSEVDVFDREAVFIEEVLKPTLDKHTDLRVVFEHITTKQAADFVTQAGDNVGATITIQHLMMNRNALFDGGLQPHHYCLPVLKREVHRAALLEAATSGNKKFFLGTDSAPHPKGKKETACGCAGIYTAFAGIEFYAEIFETAGALDKLEGFASLNGPAFYGLPANDRSITLVKEAWDIPDTYQFGQDVLVPLRAGGQLSWKLKG